MAFQSRRTSALAIAAVDASPMSRIIDIRRMLRPAATRFEVAEVMGASPEKCECEV
jgi:hypothetical protein